MPELPEAEVFRQLLIEHAVNKSIEHVEIHEGRVVKPARKTLNKALQSNILTEAKRIGKNVLMRCSGNKWLTVHFGMTGGLEYFDQGDNSPEYNQLALHFTNGGGVSFTSKRLLGKIDLTDSPEHFCQEEGLGPDALEISKEDFTARLVKKKGMLKPALMDQGLIAGLGNIYTDEILYQVKKHPKTEVSNLNTSTINELHSLMRRILKTSIRHSAKRSDLPHHYITRIRDEGEKCPDCKGKIERVKINGRSSYICPECQQI